METNSQEVRESASLHREQQTCGRCCHRNLEEDHVSRCKKFSNTFMDNKVPKQLCQNPDRRSQLTERVDNQKSTKVPNGARSLPASSSEPQGLMFQGVVLQPQAGPGAPTRSRGSAACPSTRHKALKPKQLVRERYSTAGARSENKT